MAYDDYVRTNGNENAVRTEERRGEERRGEGGEREGRGRGRITDIFLQLRAEGKFRAEGAQYIVKDGDILLFKFSTQNLK